MGVITPDGIEVVMLAGNAQTFLRIHRASVGPAFGAEKNIFKLHHTGVGKEQSAVATRNEGCAGHNFVTASSEKIEKRLTNLIAG